MYSIDSDISEGYSVEYSSISEFSLFGMLGSESCYFVTYTWE